VANDPTKLANQLRLIPGASPIDLRSEHCAGARLFANRYDMIAALNLPRNPVITEVGVAVGDFTAFLIEFLKPSEFNAFDIFRMHEIESFWGVPRQTIIGNLTHIEFYRHRFVNYEDIMNIYEGDSAHTLPLLTDKSQDLIYIDANHDLDPVRIEAEIASKKIKTDGVIVFNDYIMYDHWAGINYGVVQAVNELLIKYDWRIVGFSLHSSMFCDIAIRRRSSGYFSRLLGSR
jgi:hypothetical protein